MTLSKGSKERPDLPEGPVANRRAQILAAATERFADRGYANVSIQDIAHAAGVFKGNVYYYFPAKEDLLFEIIDDAHERFAKGLVQWISFPGTPTQRFHELVRRHVLQMCNDREPTIVSYHDFQCLSPANGLIILSKRDLYENSVTALISACRLAGEICPDIDPRMAAKGVLGMVNWIYRWYRRDGAWSPTDLAEQYADMALSSLRPCIVRGHDHTAAPLEV
jgi:TetR/AcrR family transcriptional regulator, cholesterol catabolism regulator